MEEKFPPGHPTRGAGRSTQGRRDFGDRNLPEAVGAIFRTARQLQGLSQEQVAGLTGGRHGELSRTTISDIERGKSLPNLPALVALSRTLHIEPTEILEQVDLEEAVPVDVTGLGVQELLARGQELFWAGDFRAALTVFSATLEQLVLEPPDDAEEARRIQAKVEIDRAVALRQCSALKASEAAAKRAIEAARGFPGHQAEAYMVLASLYSHDGLLEMAEHAAQKSVQLSETGDAKLQGKAWNQIGNVQFRAKKYEEARASFLKARKFAIEAGDLHDQASVEGNIGACLVDLGRYSQAKPRFVKAIELARKCLDRSAEAVWLVELGRLARQEGRLEDADRYAALALEIARPGARVLTIFRAEWLRHQVLRQQNPKAPDTKRLTLLRKLHTKVRGHKSLDVVQEYESVHGSGDDSE